MSRIRGELIALLLLAFGCAAQAETITWLIPAYPPAYIPARPDIDPKWQNEGFAEKIQDWVMAAIPGYTSERLEASFARIFDLMQAQDRLYCFATANRTAARLQYMSFSRPLYRQPGNRIFVRNDAAGFLTPYLDADEAVDLARLVHDKAITGTIVSGRSYTPGIDAILADAPTLDRQPQSETPPKLLLAGRTDWILAYPRELEWLWRQDGQNKENAPRPYHGLAIHGEARFTQSHIGCVNTPAGTKFIAKIDEAMAATPSRPWRSFMTVWLSDEDRRATDLADQAAANAAATHPEHSATPPGQ